MSLLFADGRAGYASVSHLLLGMAYIPGLQVELSGTEMSESVQAN
jgi:hypothetical protein